MTTELAQALPTLFIKGKLSAPDGSEETKRELDKYVPMEYIMNWFRTRVGLTGVANRVLILKSETASGKSTAFPPELYRNMVLGQSSPGIICTQPRILTAIENVREIMKHYSRVLVKGETIGWSTKNNKLRPKSYGLLSATIGTLTTQLRSNTDEEIMAMYRYILVDETHERDLQTDMTIYMLKNLLMRNRGRVECPFVVLMSATFEPQRFLDYFDVDAANFIWCQGETAGFDEMWDWNEGRTVNDYIRAASTLVEKIMVDHRDDPPERADVLIFMPGAAEFATLMTWLNKINETASRAGKPVFVALQLDSVAVAAQNEDYRRLIHIPTVRQNVQVRGRPHTPARRIIIATNVAETGLTLDNLKYVIDGGYNREIEYNPVDGIRALVTKPVSEARVKQRRGRAGRKFRGVFYPLYPKYVFDRLPKQQLPQILVEDISGIFIGIMNEQIKATGSFGVARIDMVDTPTPDAISAAIEKLYNIGFIDVVNTDDVRIAQNLIDASTPAPILGTLKITELGSLYAQMTITPESARMIFAAYAWGCSILDMVTIAAYLTTIQSVNFVESKEKIRPQTISWGDVYRSGLPGFIANMGILYKTRLLIADDFINGLILFNAIKSVMRGVTKTFDPLRDWCAHCNISMRAVFEFIRMREEIIEQLLLAGLDVTIGASDSLWLSRDTDFMDIITRIKYCIYDGYRCNLLTRVGEEYVTAAGLRVNPPKLFRENEAALAEKAQRGYVMAVRPTRMVYRELSLKFNHKTGIYDTIAEQISTCDGFVNIDLDFAM